MKPLRASQLPTLRDAIRRDLNRTAGQVASILDLTADVPTDVLYGEGVNRHRLTAFRSSYETVVGDLVTCDMWWVSPDLSVLALDTALDDGELPELDAQRPIGTAGVMHFSGGLTVEMEGGPHHFDTLTWTPYLGANAGIGTWVRTADGVIGVDDAMYSAAEQEALLDILHRLAVAVTFLAQEPNVTQARPATYDRDGDPRDTRRKPIPGVTVIGVRPRPNPPVGPDGKPIAPGKTYTHRWIVRGFWNTFWVGKGRTEKARRWIAPYVAGPEGLPLVVKDRVWALRSGPKPDQSGDLPAA